MAIKNIDSKIIVAKFALNGYNIHPEAIDLIKNSGFDLDDIISEISRFLNNSFIIMPEDVKTVIKILKEKKELKTKKKEKIKEENKEIKILKDITGKSTCRGTVEDFVTYFNSRFESLYNLLKKRINAIPISSLGKIKYEVFEIIGFVDNIKEISENKAIFDIEDKTGRVRVIAEGKLKEIVMELLGDEVIGVVGKLKGKNIIADRIIFPDVPINGSKLKKDFRIVFISDTHFGSNKFLKDAWNNFVSWINCESRDEKMNEIAESVKYVFIAGDIVDGIGIYPEQDKELEILDIYEQYEFAAEQLNKIRDDIKIFLSPGNHDAVRQAEPQPSLPKEFAKLFSNNIIHVGNPAYINVEGVKVLMYHGRSLDDIVSKLSRLNYDEPQKVMIELLKRRHLCPIYGKSCPIAPEKEDYLVIDEVPDVFHSGHVHTYGAEFYRGIFVVNSSTWQAQTEFQKKVNLNPMPGNVAVYQPGGTLHKLKFFSS